MHTNDANFNIVIFPRLLNPMKSRLPTESTQTTDTVVLFAKIPLEGSSCVLSRSWKHGAYRLSTFFHDYPRQMSLNWLNARGIGKNSKILFWREANVCLMRATYGVRGSPVGSLSFVRLGWTRVNEKTCARGSNTVAKQLRVGGVLRPYASIVLVCDVRGVCMNVARVPESLWGARRAPQTWINAYARLQEYPRRARNSYSLFAIISRVLLGSEIGEHYRGD